MFRPPTEGYEEQPIDEAVIEFLQPRPTVRAIVANCDLTVGAIKTGDVIMVEPTSNIADKAIVLLRKDAETIIAKIYKNGDKWFAVSEHRKGALSDQIEVIGRVRAVIKNQLL
ncbi:S24 family peptidase [Photobacterium damselae]